MAGKKRRGRGNRTQKFAVEQEGVQDEVLQMFKDGIPATQISKKLNVEKKVEISPLAINRWLKAQREREHTETALESKEKYDVVAMDYTNQVKTIFEEVIAMKDKLKDEDDVKKLQIYDKMIGRAYQGIELLGKITGDVKQKGAVDINIIINEINSRTFDEKRGLRNAMHGFGAGEIIDVEAEIISEDKKKEKELRGE